jgi:hypothetical protein
MTESKLRTAERKILRQEWRAPWRVWKSSGHITGSLFLRDGLPLTLDLLYTEVGDLILWRVVMCDTERFSLELAQGEDLAQVLRSAKGKLARILRGALSALGEVSNG